MLKGLCCGSKGETPSEEDNSFHTLDDNVTMRQ